ncbi:MAG: polynucleotide kinase-phosphatase, partial [Chloroflexota bacterium]
MNLTFPDLSLVVLVGPSGSGKSTFAATHFQPAEVISSDTCRALVSNDENNMSATADAFEVLNFIAGKRLERGLLTVIDATSVKPEDRRPLVNLARSYHVLPVAIVLNMSERLCQDRNRDRTNRDFGPHVLRNQSQSLRRSLKSLKREGFRQVYVLNSAEELAEAVIVRQPLWNDRKGEHGPFDIIGDIHGCATELTELLESLGYRAETTAGAGTSWETALYRHPEGRQAIFIGDLVDRGPRIVDTLRTVRAMVGDGALCVPGNHDMKLLKKLQGREVQVTHGLEASIAEIEQLPDPTREEFVTELCEFLHGLVSHYVLDRGKLVVAHAGMKESMQGRGSSAVRNFALYGETTGETDEFGLPVRHDWAAEYRGGATVVYGHTPVPEPQRLNNTINIDTGCVFGGSLTALRYPEQQLVSVVSHQTYYEPVRRFLAPENAGPMDAQRQYDSLLSVDEVLGKRLISTCLHRSVTIREENAAATLEVMSRFAIAPQALIYLPPTMSPSETSSRGDLLEHPAEAFAYYRREGVSRVICEEKHMGSRAIVVVCRNPETASLRLGVEGSGIGVCYTRTGRPFFESSMQAEMLERVQRAATEASLWEQFETDWLCLDCEIMPWSAKAQELLQRQYAPVGAAGRAALAGAASTVEQAAARGIDVGDHLAALRNRASDIDRYVQAYGRYCWPVQGVNDLKIAPFHLLATEGKVHVDRDHLWHLRTLAMLSSADPELFLATRHLVVDVTDPEIEA